MINLRCKNIEPRMSPMGRGRLFAHRPGDATASTPPHLVGDFYDQAQLRPLFVLGKTPIWPLPSRTFPTLISLIASI
jgi:hypothetical protein